MVFAVFDHDSLVSALQTVWDEIAPPAMFTASANNVLANSEDFTNALDIIKWNAKVSETALEESKDVDRTGYGFSFSKYSDSNGLYSNPIDPQSTPGSNNTPIIGTDGFVEDWGTDGDDIYVPAGFAPIRGENVIYADTLPPSTLQVA